jgi:hypothetical protein
MQIFCDESGGIDQGHFLVAAVRIDGGEATRMLKTIRRLTGFNGPELKGNDLNVGQIKTVFSVISRHPDAVAVSVICRRDDPLGGWAAGNFQEHQIWRELVVESCLPLHQKGVQGIVPDGGRYKKAILRATEAEIAEAVARRAAQQRVPVSCANSTSTPGIQIADVISNAVHRSISGYADAEECRQILAEAEVVGQIRIAMLEMAERRPIWLDACYPVP